MFKNTNDNHNSSSQYIVLDLEFLYDAVVYQRYQSRDPNPARCRWPMRRVVAASVMALEVSGGQLTVTAFRSFSGTDEAKLLVGLFGFLGERPTHKLVTWGGISADTPVLRIAAMEHGLKLPSQVRFTDRSRHVHLDLDIAMKGGTGDHVHMSEVAARLNIPCKIAGMASSVPLLAKSKNFRACEHIAESDVCSAAMLLAAYLSAQGELLSAKAGQLAIIRFVRELRGRAHYAGILGNVANRLRAEISQEMQTWMSRVA